MFNKVIHLEMIDMESKMSLKVSCLKACGNNVDRAKELYEFLSADLTGIPDIPPVRPGGFDQVKQSANEIFKWIGSHKEDISQGIAFVQSLRSKAAPVAAAAGTPPIPKI